MMFGEPDNDEELLLARLANELNELREDYVVVCRDHARSALLSAREENKRLRELLQECLPYITSGSAIGATQRHKFMAQLGAALAGADKDKP